MILRRSNLLLAFLMLAASYKASAIVVLQGIPATSFRPSVDRANSDDWRSWDNLGFSYYWSGGAPGDRVMLANIDLPTGALIKSLRCQVYDTTEFVNVTLTLSRVFNTPFARGEEQIFSQQTGGLPKPGYILLGSTNITSPYRQALGYNGNAMYSHVLKYEQSDVCIVPGEESHGLRCGIHNCMLEYEI